MNEDALNADVPVEEVDALDIVGEVESPTQVGQVCISRDLFGRMAAIIFSLPAGQVLPLVNEMVASQPEMFRVSP